MQTNRQYVYSFARWAFCSRDLDLGWMTLILDLDRDILKTHVPTEYEVSRTRLSNVMHEQDRQTHTDATERITTPPHS